MMKRILAFVVLLVALAWPVAAGAQISGRVAEASRKGLEALRRSSPRREPLAPRRVEPLPGLYRVTLKRLESNLYLDTQSKTIIETRSCSISAFAEDGLLKWRVDDRWSVYDELIFSTRIDAPLMDRCDVVGFR